MEQLVFFDLSYLTLKVHKKSYSSEDNLILKSLTYDYCLTGQEFQMKFPCPDSSTTEIGNS